MNNITYRPFIRDSALGDINIQIPNLEIPVYKPRYSQPLEDDTETEVQSQVEEIRNPEPIVQETTVHKFNSKKDFKDTMLPIYERLLKSKGLNPAFAKSLVAQDGLESAWGSKPAGSYNFGGIKGKGTTKRTREVINGKDVYINDQFRNFKSLEDYANFKIDLLNNKRYNAFSGDIKEFANRVHRGGYATDPRYANILNQVIASAKHGGVLKFQQGGIQEGKQWLEDWYKSRKGLVKQNVKQVLPIPLPVTESLVFNALKRNLDLTRAKINPSKVPDNASGVLRNAYNDPEHYYDYSKGSYDPDTEHWSDRDPVTGMELKNPNHPTAFMHYEVEQQLGNKRYQDSNGRYYTFPNGEAPIWRNIYGPLSETPGLKEVKYPSYGKGKANMEESIKDNLPRIKWIWNELINAGASSEQAAAILGNFWKENQIQPYGKASSKGAVGLAQLLGQRYNAYKEYLNNNNLIDSTEAQIKYLVPIIFGDDKNPHNLTGDYTYWINKNKPKYIDKYDSFLIDWNKSQRNAFRNAKGLDNLTIAFADNFERMGKNEADYEVRKEAARYIYNLMLNGQ